jgi:hypothetical protein
MQIRQSMIVWALLISLMAAFAVHAQNMQVLLSSTADKWVLVPKSDIGLTWRAKLDYDQTGWTLCSGNPGGIGYEMDNGYQQWITLDTRNDMYEGGVNPNTSCYVRVKFTMTADQLTSLGSLNLNVWYDDGFVAYLNGAKVADANAPATLMWNAAASGSHEAGGPETFGISDFKSSLKEGENLLAIQALNTSITSSDFLINVELNASENPFSDFTSSNLPIIYINTGGKGIPDEPKIAARMGIIYHKDGQLSQLNEPYNDYNGSIGIETRGSSSQSWPKKQYSVETWTSTGADTSVSLMGLPKENDWVLNAPFIDKSFLRNVLAYDLFRRMGRYASRTRYCELFLNGEYQGIYVLMEKIKRDKNRVDISRLDSTDVAGDALTGGYIFKIDKTDGAQNSGFDSKYKPYNGSDRRVYYQYHYPSQNNITPQQKTYLQSYVNRFEDMMAGSDYDDPETGYPKWINIDSFVDFFIISEVSKNVDCYRLSTFMYKDRDSIDGRLVMGPIWDYNLAFGLANYYDGWDMDGWMLDELLANTGNDFPVPFWWHTLFEDPQFNHRIKQRWIDLRGGVMDPARILNFIDNVADTLNEAQARNFTIWSAPGEPGVGFWPVPTDVTKDGEWWMYRYVTDWNGEIEYLKTWVEERIKWMDANVLLLSDTLQRDDNAPPLNYVLHSAYPNPFNPSTTIEFELPTSAHVRLQIYNANGQLVRTLVDEQQNAGAHTAAWDGMNDASVPAASGVYHCRLIVNHLASSESKTVKMLLVH